MNLSKGIWVKNILLLITVIGLASLIVVQCTTAPFKPEIDDGLTGSWEWRQSCGGIGGWCSYADSVEYRKTIIISKGRNLVRMQDDSVVFSGTYEIVRKPFWGTTDTSDVLVTEGFLTEMKIEGLGTDSLQLAERCIDCFGHLYINLGDN